jgi:flavin-dependent dehydrogenase
VIHADIIVVGGGPAGASCAWTLRQNGREAVVLDKEPFPRTKPCAGWITPSTLKDLDIQPGACPFGMLSVRRIAVHLFGRRFVLPTRQYSIRRREFDSWMLERSGVPVFTHRVRKIRAEGQTFIIDDAFRCRFLVGAGGTSCPVYSTFFRDIRPRTKESLIVTLEEEFACTDSDDLTRLWFFEKGLPGYAWYVPKIGGFVNVGLGGKYRGLAGPGNGIREHWKRFEEKLRSLALVGDHEFSPRGYSYFIRKDTGPMQRGNIYITGDAAGLATVDMGEGIGPAVASGILAAKAIISGKRYSPASMGRFSLWSFLFPRR